MTKKKTKPCPDCNGAGIIPGRETTNPGPNEPPRPCPRCGGTGEAPAG